MNINSAGFDPRQLCSRKLWQLVNTPADEDVSESELKQAIAELAKRRHYLEKLQQIGKLENQNTGA